MDQDGHWVEGDSDDGDEWESADDDKDDTTEDTVEGEDVLWGEWSPSNDTVIPLPIAPHDSSTPMVVDPAPGTLEGTSRPTSATGREHTPDVPKDAADDEGDDADEPRRGVILAVASRPGMYFKFISGRAFALLTMTI